MSEIDAAELTAIRSKAVDRGDDRIVAILDALEKARGEIEVSDRATMLAEEARDKAHTERDAARALLRDIANGPYLITMEFSARIAKELAK